YDRQRVADDAIEALREHAPQPRARHLIVEARIERIDVDGEAPLAPQVVPDVLVPGDDVVRAEIQGAREALDEELRLGRAVAVGDRLVGEEGGIAQARLAVGAPVRGKRPRRQLLAGVPLALAEMQEA